MKKQHINQPVNTKTKRLVPSTKPMLLLATACALALSGCNSSKLKKPEPKPTKLVKLAQNQSPLALKWSYKLGGGDSKDPLRLQMAKLSLANTQGSGATRYVAASRDGDVVALDDSGKRVWETDIDVDITSAVGANGNTVVVVDENARVHALNPVDGSVVWKRQLSGTVLAPALVTKRQVVVASNNGVITGIDSNTGQNLWNFTINVPSLSLRGMAAPISLSQNIAVVAAADGRIHAMRTDSGVPLWARRVGISSGSSEFDRLNDIDADPVFYEFVLYTASFQGQVVGIDMKTRQELFQIPVSSVKKVGVNDSLLFVATTDGELKAYDRLSGKPVWSLDALKYRGLSNPVALSNGTVIVGDEDGYLHTVTADSGKLIGRVSTSGAVDSIELVTAANDGASTQEELLVETESGTLSVWQVR